ncbi:C40 family peptidase [Solitalea koreensis]|uniref:SH3 domain-containing protein n=1 Tax=Solitalea koreensis TaxID=543615 RepID=A0A521BKF6_9SPHI|nr:C40 family peptidase [Solitalea koreensis]SMO47624.1 SH3 domain-containing protein [Solitalea koreensis]
MIDQKIMEHELILQDQLTDLYGICNLSCVPVRAEASDKSEMISQLLFGEHFRILEQTEKWSRIKISYDDYEGWIDNKQFQPMNRQEFEVLKKEPVYLSTSPFDFLTNALGHSHYLSPGSNLPFFNGDSVFVHDEKYYLKGKAHIAEDPATESSESLFKMFLNAPYLWGGRSILGIDCSGYTQICFKVLGVKLKRDAYQQAEQGELVNFVHEAKLGDLAFFDNAEGRITHVGIMLNNHQIIHASGKVRIDQIDHNGIFNSVLQEYTHQLRVIKRVL